LTSAPEKARRRQILRALIAVLAIAVAAFFIAVAIVYWALPADSLPSWLPGHKAASHPFHGHHHKRHGLAALLLGLTFLAFARLLLRGKMRGREAA
jgi:H+/Cl- antiporter ClcA